MSKLLSMRSLQAYQSLERKTKRISLADLLKLQLVFEKDIGTREEFWDLVEEEAIEQIKDKAIAQQALAN